MLQKEIFNIAQKSNIVRKNVGYCVEKYEMAQKEKN